MSQPSSENPIASGAMRTKPSLKSVAIIVCLIVVALPSLILFSRCGKSRDAARRELESKAIPYTEQEFVNRVRRRDLETVRLFLAAEINPDSKDQEGATVLMGAVLSNDSGIIEALLHARDGT